ncbi:flippase [Prosthecobacter sp.]|uniref:flippase n=1 Tax=Prosthecobacter sp. TaxID=1965333 RepID=UPI0037837FDB
MNQSSQAARHSRGGLHGMVSGFSKSAVLRVLRLGINVVVTGLLARHLGSAGFGALAASLAMVSLLYTLAELGMGRVLVRELMSEGADHPAIMGSSFYTRLAAGLILFGGLAVYAWCFEPPHAALLLIYGVVLLAHAATDVLAWFETDRRMHTAAWCQFGGFMLSMIAIVAGVAMQAPLWFFALTYVIECLATVVMLYVHYRRSGGAWRAWRWEKRRSVALLRESWFEIATQFALLMLLRMDAIMVLAMRGDAEAGYYSAAVRISEVAYFLPMMLATFMMPPLIERKRSGAADYRDRLADYFGLSFALTFALALSVAVTSKWVVALLFGEAFQPAAAMLMVHAWALIPFALGVARTQYLTIEGRLWANLPAVLAGLVINAFLNWLWIPTYGGLGAAWATLIAYCIAWLVSTPAMAATRDLTSLMMRGFIRLPHLLQDTSARLLNGRRRSTP